MGTRVHTLLSLTLLLITAIISPFGYAQSLPVIAYKTLEGEPVTISQYKGEVRVINFWATWCPPCIREMPALGRLNNELKPDHGRVIAINVGDEAEAVEAFVLENFEGKEPEIWLDEPGESFTKLRIEGLPMTLLLDRDGNILDKVIGERHWDSPKMVKAIKALSDREQ